MKSFINFTNYMKIWLIYFLLFVMLLFTFQPIFATTSYANFTNFKKLRNDGNLKFNITRDSFRYSGYYYDAETKNDYLNARYYSPELMSFISRDTYDLANRYAYCGGNPLENSDPTGHSPFSFLGYKPLNYTLAGLTFVAGAGTCLGSGGTLIGFSVLALGTISGGTQVASSMVPDKRTSDILNYTSMATAIDMPVDDAVIACKYSVNSYRDLDTMLKNGDHVFVDMDKTLIRKIPKDQQFSSSVFSEKITGLTHEKYNIQENYDVYINPVLRNNLSTLQNKGVNVHILTSGGWKEDCATIIFDNDKLKTFTNLSTMQEYGYAKSGIGKVMSKGRFLSNARFRTTACIDSGQKVVLLDDQWHQRTGAMLNGFYAGDARKFRS